MAVPTLLSPNVGNLAVGKGIVSFKKTGEPSFRDVGEVREFEITLAIEQLDHFTQRSGVREKDFTVVLERGGQARMIMEEWTPENLAIMLMGIVDVDAPGGATLTIMEEDASEGELRFVGTNDVGPKWTVILDRVRFIPSASLNMLSDEWAGLEISGEILKSEITSAFGTAQLTNLGSET